jgi:hypothetical protein
LIHLQFTQYMLLVCFHPRLFHFNFFCSTMLRVRLPVSSMRIFSITSFKTNFVASSFVPGLLFSCFFSYLVFYSAICDPPSCISLGACSLITSLSNPSWFHFAFVWILVSFSSSLVSFLFLFVVLYLSSSLLGSPLAELTWGSSPTHLEGTVRLKYHLSLLQWSRFTLR